MNGLESTAGLPDLAALAVQKSPGAPASLLAAPSPLPKGRGLGIGIRLFSPHSEVQGGKEVHPLTLKELTKGICRGDEAAFTRFYDLYSLRIYKYLLVMARGDEREAREVLQTVVVKLARKFKVFDEERRMWGWISRLARNTYVDLYRARRRELHFVSLEEHTTELVEHRHGEHRLSESLRHALEQLTAEERELMRSAYVDERPLQELADASGQTYKAVESRLGRLRLKLKTNLLKHLRHEESA